MKRSSGKSAVGQKFLVGEHVGPFCVKEERWVEGLDAQVRLLLHPDLGTKVFHIAREDSENFFSISFPTLPQKDHGVAHILEHIVLCGSENYPVRDPFFCMLRRSMNTFMNALTGNDFTAYPAATQNKKDFYNLLEVYLDAVFFPNLTRSSFLQEGHRLIWKEEESQLLFGGVVYNEMKGAYSSVTERMWKKMFRSLFPDTVYGKDSGGDPLEIPTLTYEELLQFHQQYYSVSNATFFFYGNLPLERHIQTVEDKVLAKAKKRVTIPSIPMQGRFPRPSIVKEEFPSVAGAGQKPWVAFGWLTVSVFDRDEVLALLLLEKILMDHDAGLLKAPLIQSKLCRESSMVVEDSFQEVPVILICKECDSEEVEKLRSLILETLSSVVRDGIDESRIVAAVQQLEIEYSEIGGGRYPFGAQLFFRTNPLLQHGGDPFQVLDTRDSFALLKEKASSQWLTERTDRYFLNNNHRVDLSMIPSDSLMTEEREKEEQLLSKIKDALTEEDLNCIVAGNISLEKEQAQDLHQTSQCLPTLKEDDLPDTAPHFHLQYEQIDGLDVYHHSCGTNGLTYCDFIFNLPRLDHEDLSYVRLLCDLFTEMGGKKESFSERLLRTQRCAGMFSLHPQVCTDRNDPSKIYAFLSLTTSALEHSFSSLCSLVNDCLLDTEFVEDRVHQCVDQTYSQLFNSVQQAPLGYAMSLASSGCSDALYLEYLWSGVDYVWFLKRLLERWENEKNLILNRLTQLQGRILSRDNMHCVCSNREPFRSKLRKHLSLFGSGSVPSPKTSVFSFDGERVWPISQGRLIPSSVMHNVFTFPIPDFSHEDTPALAVGAAICDHVVLHSRIREKGGAYGGGTKVQYGRGYMSFFSFRDPHLCSTRESFKAGAQQIVNGTFSEQDLLEARIAVMQGIHAPVAPKDRGHVGYIRAIRQESPEMRNQFCNRVLNVSKEEISQAFERRLLSVWEDGVFVSFGGEEMLESENERLKQKGMNSLPLLKSV